MDLQQKTIEKIQETISQAPQKILQEKLLNYCSGWLISLFLSKYNSIITFFEVLTFSRLIIGGFPNERGSNKSIDEILLEAELKSMPLQAVQNSQGAVCVFHPPRANHSILIR